VFVECAEKMEFPGFGLLRQAKTAPWGDEHNSPKEKTEPGGLKDGGWVYTDTHPGAKKEIPGSV
jgi:hypothetical protein